jgi:hypothetical protein
MNLPPLRLRSSSTERRSWAAVSPRLERVLDRSARRLVTLDRTDARSL